MVPSSLPFPQYPNCWQLGFGSKVVKHLFPQFWTYLCFWPFSSPKTRPTFQLAAMKMAPDLGIDYWASGNETAMDWKGGK